MIRSRTPVDTGSNAIMYMRYTTPSASSPRVPGHFLFVGLALVGLSLAGVLLFAGCSVPGVGYVGGGPLPLDALAVTVVDVETGNVTSKVGLRWPAAPGAKVYDVIRKFGENPAKVLTTIGGTSYDDNSVGAGQSFAFKVQAISGDGKNLTTSDEKPVVVLKQEVGKPAGLLPADNASIGVGETPTLSWKTVENAKWYYVRVNRGDTDALVYSALTRDTSIRFGASSPLAFEKFGDLFPTQSKADIARGVIHRWSVAAVRSDGGDDPNRVKAIDVNPSAVQRFSLGG